MVRAYFPYSFGTKRHQALFDCVRLAINFFYFSMAEAGLEFIFDFHEKAGGGAKCRSTTS